MIRKFKRLFKGIVGIAIFLGLCMVIFWSFVITKVVVKSNEINQEYQKSVYHYHFNN